jgi:hypothetical protein
LNPFDLKESLRRGFKTGEFDLINVARKDPNSPWMQTEKRMPNMALFLGTYDSFPLKERSRPKWEAAQRRQGLSYDRRRDTTEVMLWLKRQTMVCNR